VYEFPKEVHFSVQEAIEDIRNLLNNGRYVLYATTTEPTYSGTEGETVLYNAGANKYVFYYISGSWYYEQLTQGPLP